MRRFAVSDRHTLADIGLEIEATSLEELFIAAAEGLYHLFAPNYLPESRKGEKSVIQLKASDINQLLIDWLSELIYQFDGNHKFVNIDRIELKPGSPCYLRADVKLNDIGKDACITGHDIKAITYYKLNITYSNGVFATPVVFDL